MQLLSLLNMNTTLTKPWELLQKLAISTLIFLVLEYIAGMWLNIYTGAVEGGAASAHVIDSPVLHIHILISLALLIHATVMIVISAKHKVKSWLYISILSLFSILVAADQGYRFIKEESNLSSFIMAFAFILAFCSYAYGIILNKDKVPPSKDTEI